MWTAKAAKDLQAGDHLTVDGAPGLRLVATATRRTWIYRYKSPADGRMRQIRIGAWPAIGLPAALAKWQALKEQRDAGGDPAAERRQARRSQREQQRAQALTVRRLADDWLDAYQPTVSAKHYGETQRLLNVELGDLAARPAAELTRGEAYALIEAMRAGRPVLAARMRQIMGAIWDRAIDAGALPEETPNWWRMILRGKMRSRGRRIGGEHVGVIERALSADELRLLLPWLPNFSRAVEDAFILQLWTCCRGAEILKMERGELAEEDGVLWWTIPRAKLKMRRVDAVTDLRVPLVGRAEAVVRRRAATAAGSYLWPAQGSGCPHMQQKVLGVAVWERRADCDSRPERVRPRLPISDWAPHDLRRTSRTLLSALGCPREVGEAILGHLPPGVVGTYDKHAWDAERVLWLTRLADRLEQLAGSSPATKGR